MNHRHAAGLGRVLELLVTAPLGHFLPSVGLDCPYDVSAIHVCKDTHWPGSFQHMNTHDFLPSRQGTNQSSAVFRHSSPPSDDRRDKLARLRALIAVE
jgi:hypothetical protein